MKLKSLLTAVAGLLLGHTARAIPYNDINNANVYLNILNTSYTGEFDIAADGFNPLTQEIYSATAEFTFWDGLFSEAVSVTLGGAPFSSGTSFTGFITLGGGITGSAFFDLSADGKLSYTVARNSGEFWLTKATLTAEAGARSVPEGGSSTLLLIGSVVLIGVAHRGRRPVR